MAGHITIFFKLLILKVIHKLYNYVFHIFLIFREYFFVAPGHHPGGHMVKQLHAIDCLHAIVCNKAMVLDTLAPVLFYDYITTFKILQIL